MLELARLLRARKNVLEHDGARPLRMPTSGAPPSRHCHRRGTQCWPGRGESLNKARVLTAECASSLPWLHQRMGARRRGPPPIGLAGHSCLRRPPCWRSSTCYSRGHLMSTMHGGQGTGAAGPCRLRGSAQSPSTARSRRGVEADGLSVPSEDGRRSSTMCAAWYRAGGNEERQSASMLHSGRRVAGFCVVTKRAEHSDG